MKATALLLIMLLLQLLLHPVQPMQIDGQGKLDFSVWVDDDRVRSDQDIVKFIKHLQLVIKKTSQKFYKATELLGRRRLQIGNVRIDYPRRWQEAVSAETWPAGITLSSATNKHSPDFLIGKCGNSVVQINAACGRPGVVALLDSNKLLTDSIDSVAQNLLQQLAQLRYGVFSENIQQKHFIDSAGRMRSTSCSENAAAATDSAPTASIMWSSSATAFCTNTRSNIHLTHNDAAPNLHNRLCANASTGEVILRHSDFSSSTSATWTEPQLVLQQHPVTAARMKVILVIDISGSMGGLRISLAKDAASRFVMQYLEDSVDCGLISFNHNVQRLQNPLSLTSYRANIRNQIQSLNPTGGTNASPALEAAVSMLGYSNINSLPSSAKGTIVFICDADTNFGNRINLLAATQIRVHTIGVGVSSDSEMSILAERTGGKAYFTNAADLVGFEAAFSGIAKSADGYSAFITLRNDRVLSSFQRTTVNVDDSIKRSLTFSMQFMRKRRYLQVRSPSGRVYNSGSGSHIFSQTTSGNIYSMTIIIPNDQIEIGEWQMENQHFNDGGEEGAVSVSGRASEKPTEYPMLLEAGLSHSDINKTVPEKTRIIVTASLRKFCSAVIGADIEAELKDSTDQRIAVLPLYDIGVGPDAKKDDGIYSNYLPLSKIRNRGYYSILVRSKKPVSRFISAGRLFVTNDASSNTIAPPARVDDLRVFGQTESELHLQWTAVGRELFYGDLINTYKVYMSTNATEIIEGKRMITTSCYAEPKTVNTLASTIGDAITLTVRLPTCIKANSRVFVAVKALASSSGGSELSNIAWYRREEIKNQPQGLTGGAVAGIVIVIVLLLVIASCIALGVFIIYSRGYFGPGAAAAGGAAVPVDTEEEGVGQEKMAMMS